MFSGISGVVIQGGTLNNINHTVTSTSNLKGLMEWVATGAFHDSHELYEPVPKCHPHTRVAVLDAIMQWVGKTDSLRDDFILWLFGPAGAGKTAIAKKIAELAAEKDLLIATFFFSRTSPTRSTEERFVATLAYQLSLSIPDTRTCIEDAINQDPAIFHKNLQTQIDTLLIKPFQSALATQTIPFPKLFIIDALDECNDNQAQIAILEAISHSFGKHKLQILFLIVSRPELTLITSFNGDESLKSIHTRLALDDTYRPDADISLFFSDKFEKIRRTHPMKSTIPTSWPGRQSLEKLVRKSSGQFIYAATVVRFVESIYHRPTARLKTILGISPPGKTNPFAELDALYNHIFNSVQDIELTLRVLSLYVVMPDFADRLQVDGSMSPEDFLSLEEGDIQTALMNLPSIILYDASSETAKVTVHHASLIDFLCDKRRSTIFHIDMASTHTDFAHRILQFVKGPDGVRAGDLYLLNGVMQLFPLTLDDQLRSDILNFDLDAFIAAVTRNHYKEPIFSRFIFPDHHIFPPLVIWTFVMWNNILTMAGPSLDDGDNKEILDRHNKSFESRVQKYQSDRRLQLLFTLAVASLMNCSNPPMPAYAVPSCRCLDILLEMDDHNLHRVDQDALDLRHAYMLPSTLWSDTISLYVDGDRYASAAIHCFQFLSNPPKYSRRNDSPEMGLIYAEWKATCAMAVDILCKLLSEANTLPVLVEFLGNHEINPEIRLHLSVSRVDAAILAFLTRANVCLQRGSSATDQPLKVESYERLDEEENRDITRRLMQQRLDPCCLNVHYCNTVRLEI